MSKQKIKQTRINEYTTKELRRLGIFKDGKKKKGNKDN